MENFISNYKAICLGKKIIQQMMKNLDDIYIIKSNHCFNEFIYKRKKFRINSIFDIVYGTKHKLYIFNKEISFLKQEQEIINNLYEAIRSKKQNDEIVEEFFPDMFAKKMEQIRPEVQTIINSIIKDSDWFYEYDIMPSLYKDNLKIIYKKPHGYSLSNGLELTDIENDVLSVEVYKKFEKLNSEKLALEFNQKMINFNKD